MHRVFKSSSSLGEPILLQHGLFQSSGIFLTNENDSLAFVLANEGYDVWLGNNRGVLLEHVSLKPQEEKFWDWSLDDLGMYDLPATIDYILSKTGVSKLVFVGHSQGNAQAFLAFTHNPDLCNKIKLFVPLCPAFFIHTPK